VFTERLERSDQMTVGEGRRNKPATVIVPPPREGELSEAEREVMARYITGGRLWGRGMTSLENNLWRLFWVFLVASALLGIIAGIGLSVAFGLISSGWWIPLLLSLVLGLLAAWLVIPLFYKVFVRWYVAHNEVTHSEQQ
jgi:hypothetical protein